MRFWSISFLLGICVLMLFSALPNAKSVLLLVFVLLSVCTLLPKTWQWFRVLLLAMVLGFCWILLFTYWQLQHVLPGEVENRTVIIKGIVASIPEQITNGVRFEFTVKQLTVDGKVFPSPGKVRLVWENHFHSNAIESDIKVGEKLQLQVRLKRPHGNFNPGGFDYEAWLFTRNIRATGYVVAVLSKSESQNIRYSLDLLREHLTNQIKTQLNNNAVTGFITALSVGVRDNISQSQWQTLRNTGTNHLMAIAGLHIGLFAGFAWSLVNFLWRRISRLCLLFPAQQAAAIAALIAAFLYSALAGFSLPTLRAVIMLAVLLSAILLRRNLPVWQAYAVALFLILLLNPLAVLDMSFWLSFAAVGIIIYGMNSKKTDNNNEVKKIIKNTKFWRWIKIQLVISIGFIPLSLLFFQQVSLISFVANFLAIPWVGFIVLPLSVLSTLLSLISPQIGGLILHLAAFMMQLFWSLLQKLGSFSDLQWHVAITNSFIFISSAVGILILLASKPLLIRIIGIIFLLPLFFWQPARPKVGEVWLTLLDVGQGLSAVVQTKSHLLIYDTGPKFGDFDTGASILVPYLRTLQRNKADILILSHGDNDHIGGAQSVLQEIKVAQIITSIPNYAVQTPIPISSCIQGQQWQWDGILFQILYPPAKQIYLDNDSSCVLKITAGSRTILLPGDIEHKSEDYLLKHEENLLSSTILIAPHHGSASSSTAGFVQATHPKYVLFPTGYLNRFHFPNNNVVNHYEQLNAQLFNSASTGALIFKLNKNNVWFSSYRESHGKFWND
jgi:competence protein ComEC